MDTIGISNLLPENKITFINKNKTLFEGTIKVLQKEYFIVQTNVNQPNYKPIKPLDTIEYLIGYEKEAFRCVSKVISSKVGNTFEAALLGEPKVLVKIERRKFARLPIILEVEYAFSSEEERERNNNSSLGLRRMKKSFTVDISGGGVKIITYESNENLKYCWITLFIKEEIKVLCSVVRTEYDEKNKNFRASLKFENIDAKQRDLIIKFVDERLGNGK